MIRIHQLACMAASCAVSSLAFATEGGGSTYAAGGDIFLQGAVPPPGLYVLQYGNAYRATRLNDDAGNALPIPGFKVRALATATRVVWSTPYAIGNGNLVLHAILPVVNLHVSAGGANQTKTGLGDITFGPGITSHYSDKLHSVLGVDLVAPTGRFETSDLANIGRNYWSVQPLYTMSYIDPQGFNGDFKATLNINRRNAATDYQSGKEFILEYTAGYAVAAGWVAGVSGYWYAQLSKDEQGGRTLEGTKGRAFAIGPAFKYANDKGWIFTGKLQRETFAHNRTEGTALVVKATIPF